MQFVTTEQNGKMVAVVESENKVITNVQSALDLLATLWYEAAGCSRMVISKDAVCDEFFILSTRLAGEVLQKLVNYRTKLAIYGDFSNYTSKPLRDFIYESNNGRDIFFAPDMDEAIRLVTQAD